MTTKARTEWVDISDLVKAEVTRSKVKNGYCNLFVPHTTAGVTINENTDPNVVRDILNTLERLIPMVGDYRHAEGNSDAHAKASVMGFSVTIPVINGQPNLGTWQGIYFCEFDGPRNRKIKIGVFGEKE